MENKENQSGAGAIFGIVIIIIVLLIGAIYFLKEKAIPANNQAKTELNDDIESLQKDIVNMNFDDLGKGIDDLE